MATGVAAAPDPDPAGIDFRQGAGVRDGVPVVPDLGPRVDLLAGLALAGPEAAVVEHQRIQPGRGEHLGEAVQVHLLDRGETVRHDDGGPGAARPALSRVEPATQRDALSVELDIAPRNCGHLRLWLSRPPVANRPPVTAVIPVCE